MQPLSDPADINSLVQLFLLLALLLIIGNGLFAAVYTSAQQRFSPDSLELFYQSVGASGMTALVSSAVLLFPPDQPSGWQLLSGLMALGLVVIVVPRWMHSFRAGLRIPLLLTVAVLFNLTVLSLNVLRLEQAWPLVLAITVHFFAVGLGNFLFVLAATVRGRVL